MSEMPPRTLATLQRIHAYEYYEILGDIPPRFPPRAVHARIRKLTLQLSRNHGFTNTGARLIEEKYTFFLPSLDRARVSTFFPPRGEARFFGANDRNYTKKKDRER